jgi:hypothetical protein
VKRLIAIALFCAALASPAAATDLHGAWTATTDAPDRVHLFMTTGPWQQFGHSFDISTLGIQPSVIQATTSTPVTLKLDRDAGTLMLEGTFKNGDGAGQFTFAPNRSYFESIRAMGLTADLPDNRTDGEQLFSLAVIDVSLAYIRSMRAVFPDASLREFRKARAVGVTPDYVASMRQSGFEITNLHDAARLSAVGVTSDYIRSMRAAGVDVRDAREATRLRAVNVTPEFVAQLAGAGYRNLTTRDLIRLASVGVDDRFIRDMSKYRNQK